MFEKLAGNVLSKILSKYFTDESLAKNKATQSAQLGIWSGYISLQNLEVKKEIINAKLRGKGQPFELVHCSLRQLEITIPWAKLSNPISSGNGIGTSPSSPESAVVLVLDGVHVLFRTSFAFHDEELRAEEIKKRRQALSRSENFAKSSTDIGDENDISLEGNKTYTEILRERITSGLIQEIAEKVHIHIRDLHIRIEDNESDPESPFAFGITMESMHVQHADNEKNEQTSNDNAVVAKVAQINHFAAYWNALGYGDSLPVEHSVLHETCAGNLGKMSRALDLCIVRRGSLISSPSKESYIPTHTFILLPVGGQLNFLLSNTPKDLSLRPAIDVTIELDCISTNLRDFQCVQMLRLYGERKNFNFVKKYRKFRPRFSVLEDSKAWWCYAARVIQFELRENFLRWSWSRFQKKYAIRSRYMKLYGRRIRQLNTSSESSPDDTEDQFLTPLTPQETNEMQDMEDGERGDLSVTDIILYRALVNMKNGGSSCVTTTDGSNSIMRSSRSSWWKDTVRDATLDDIEARDEFGRLLQYLDEVPNSEYMPGVRNDSLTAIAVTIQVEEVRFALFSPLYITAEETQLKRLHEKFLELNSQVTRIGGSLKGDYKKFDLEFSVTDLTVSEIRMDKSQHVVASQLKKETTRSFDDSDGQNPLFFFAFAKNPPTNPEVNKELRMLLNPLEINMNPDCQWLAHLKGFMREVTTAPNVEKFWGELSLAYLNSLTLGKLGLMAKAESAASDHENLDVDINMYCPVLRIGMGDASDLVIDLGVLSLKTDRLAGISRNKFNKLPLIKYEDPVLDDLISSELRQNSTDESSFNGSRSPRTPRIPSSIFRTPKSLRKSVQNHRISSAMSIGTLQVSERGNQSFSGSFDLDDAFPSKQPDSERKNSQQESNIEELFYDKYLLRVQTGKVTFSGETEIFDISTGIELRTTIQKSVIPTDHTLCKLKAHTVIGKMKLVVNEDLLSRFGVAVKIWKSLVHADVASQTYRRASNKSTSLNGNRGPYIQDFTKTSFENNSDSSETDSEIEEGEFFDAREGSESVGGENSGIWFEDNWIADAESVIDGESGGSSNDRRHRRRQPSISDVSSMSDHSKNRRGGQNGYLNAENLARLEEDVGEDDSVAESGKEMDDDSFHSVMSTGGQVKLLRDLEESIKESEVKIKKLSAILVENAQYLSDTSDAELQERRLKRKKIKQELDRSKAELKALKALCYDLDFLLSDNHDNPNSGLEKEALAATAMQQARTAKALIREKKRRDSTADDQACHMIMKNLNRELFKGSIIIKEIQLTLRTGKNSCDVLDDEVVSDCELVVNQVALALFHYANDTKLYFSLDQATATVSNMSNECDNSTALLFSGGSSDTALPVHLPHLVAHSMEDRFLRGVMDIRRHRSAESFRHLTKSCRLRLVVGDVEVSPSRKCIIPICQCIRRVKAAMALFKPPSHTTDSSLVEANVKVEKVKKSQQHYDLALRLTSIRLALTCQDQVIGAVVVTESSLRLLQLTSQDRNRIQIDIRCANAQILDITNLEMGRGCELFGRRDPYSSLFQLRLRSQLVPFEERGGWVVGVVKQETETKHAVRAVRNVHLGIKICSLSLLASPEAVSKLLQSGRELRQIISTGNSGIPSGKKSKVSFINRLASDAPLRWRIDVVLRRINIKFPEENKNEWNVSDDIGSKMLMAFTVVTSIQESPAFKGRVSLRMGVTDISLIRSYDDWPILEPFSVIFELVLMSQFISRLTKESTEDILPLLVRADSSLNEIDAVMTRYGWNSIQSRKTNNETWTLVLKISPLKINISVSIIGLLADISQSFRTPEAPRSRKADPSESNSATNLLPSSNSMMGRHQFGLQILIEDAEVQLLRENDSKPIAYASRLISFTMTDVNIDYSQGEQVTASILIRDSALFDLSSGKGIRVIGEDPEARLGFPYFVRVKFYMHLDGVQTIRLHINWGKIQCLVLPSFFRSIQDLKEGLKKTHGFSRGSSSKQKGKGNALARFLHHPNDVNLILSADAETFECILSSRDIIEYVKNGDKDPCGVVTFRWKASLSLALALDCLHDSSMPWLTLNLDGNFTDDGDVNLFKDFSTRYLAQNSGLLFENQERCFKLVNAFTARIDYKLSNFQALRTNIILMDLDNSPQTRFTLLPRICFKISQPVAGEQRISNPIDFELLYRAAGTSMADTAITQCTEYHVQFSQLLHLKANFVDVLLYIASKSSGGFSDSYRVSIKPILDMLKQKDSRRLADDTDIPGPNINPRHSQMPKLIDLMKSSPSVCRMEIEGFLVTCVPGGATRLNESPIIKFELSNVSSGIAAVPVNRNLNIIGRRGTNQQNGSPRQYNSGSEVMSVTVGGWIACQVTGHYHNRRLVAWEPFIEPWTADVCFGVDLVEACRWKPITKNEPDISSTLVQTESSVIENSDSETPETGKDRLREIGRLIRSPFLQSSQSSNADGKGSTFISHSDLCYLMLSSSARTTISSALYPSSDSQSETESKLFDTMPSQVPLEWLQGFGQPTKTFDSRDICGPFSISVVLSDRMSLNINLTGALIENVMGYLDNAKKTGSKLVAPHLIRNASGMTLRFREVLDTDRSKRGEHAAKIILANSSEAPLTLKRSLSQTCDPHRAYIYLELGGFEDTVGRINHGDFDIPKGKRSSNFLFKATAKIPVDAVGVHRYPLDRNVKTRADVKSNSNSRALGWIIVRVALRGNVKVVSIESPFVLKSAADSDLLCEVRDESGLSLLWRCLVPKEEGSDNAGRKDGIVSVPADIVPFIHDGSYRFSVTALSRDSSFSHEAEIVSMIDKSIEISTPPPFSPKSFGRGLIGEEEIVLPILVPPSATYCKTDAVVDSNEKVHLTACAVRIGSASFSHVDSSIEVPEQRMIFFRSPLVIRNFLALPIAVQVRVKMLSKISINGKTNGNDGSRTVMLTGWEELGVLDCGESAHWTGSLSSDRVQLRVRFVGTDGDNSRRYPGWSSPVDIPARENSAMAARSENTRTFAKMRVADADNVALDLSVAFEFGNGTSGTDQSEDESIRHYCQKFSSATRAACIFVPYWIIDGTHQDLEFFAGSPVSGQLDRGLRKNKDNDGGQKFGNTLGLAELMDNHNFLSTSSRSEFDVLMIGDENSTRLTVRKRLTRNGRSMMERNASPWSDSVPLQVGRKTRHDLTVLTPDEISSNNNTNKDDNNVLDRLVLRSSIMNANDRFGGHLGTKLIHIVNRYSISNETGRDIEISSNTGSGSNLIINATSSPQPFHFDDSRSIRFRFKEFGWTWSGLFKIRLNRREVTMRLRHKMKGQTVIVTVEARVTKKSATSLIVFRESSHPPFRLENHTMYPLNFGQALSRLGAEENDYDSLLLQYQNEDFAWDEPELHRRALIIKASGSNDKPRDIVFGRFLLDKIAPGTVLKLDSDLFTAEVVADGPTRVFRVSDASMPRISSIRNGEFEYFRHVPEVSKPLTMSLSIKITHGVGISLIDFTPKELIYIYLEDIEVDKKTDNKKDGVHFSIGNIKLNNQLWVTPYPVLLKMGRRQNGKTSIRKRNRRHGAVSISWCSSLNTHGGYGNLTLLDKIEISSEPIFVNVDGELAGLLFRMARQVAGISSSDKDVITFQSRDEELKSLLTISGAGEYAEDGDTSSRAPNSLQDDAAGELATTAAIAAKLRDSPAYNQPTTNYLFRNTSKKRKKQPLSKVQHKFYIERLKISTTKADLSWSGVLPGLLSSSLFKALTFERLPMQLRPFSNSHAYGNLEDHLQILRSHYVSVWRIVDLLMGTSSNPTFLFRAVVHTFREGCASILDSLALYLKHCSTEMTKFLPRDSKFLPIYDDGNPLQEIKQHSIFLKRVSAPFVNGTVFVLKNTSLVVSLFSLQMKYSPKSSSARHTRGLVRSRNPRLFAHLDGKDLLVEYVEGENAGKALLSRVRAGLHLGEGYLYHAEGVRQRKLNFKSKSDLNPAPLILMITLDRVLLLTGKLDQNFCSVEWEAYFTNIIHMDLLPAKEASTFPFDEIIVWHLSDPEFSGGNKVDKANTYANNLASGIDVLHSKSIFVPRLFGEQVLKKMKQIENRF